MAAFSEWQIKIFPVLLCALSKSWFAKAFAPAAFVVLSVLGWSVCIEWVCISQLSLLSRSSSCHLSLASLVQGVGRVGAGLENILLF